METGHGEGVRAPLLDAVASLFDRGSWDLLETLFPTAHSAGGWNHIVSAGLKEQHFRRF